MKYASKVRVNNEDFHEALSGRDYVVVTACVEIYPVTTGSEDQGGYLSFGGLYKDQEGKEAFFRYPKRRLCAGDIIHIEIVDPPETKTVYAINPKPNDIAFPIEKCAVRVKINNEELHGELSGDDYVALGAIVGIRPVATESEDQESYLSFGGLYKDQDGKNAFYNYPERTLHMGDVVHIEITEAPIKNTQF